MLVVPLRPGSYADGEWLPSPHEEARGAVWCVTVPAVPSRWTNSILEGRCMGPMTRPDKQEKEEEEEDE